MMVRRSMAQRPDLAVLVLYFVAPRWLRCYCEAIVSSKLAKAKIETDAKVVGMASGTSPYVVDAPSISKRMIYGGSQRLGDKPQCIEEVAFSGAEL